ncbi:MAG: hypothetical protein KGN79_11725 [Acidobacteriota bacterium]|nr:hypothetical protein [Acidobacteriota bacterium]
MSSGTWVCIEVRFGLILLVEVEVGRNKQFAEATWESRMVRDWTVDQRATYGLAVIQTQTGKLIFGGLSFPFV